MTGALLSVDGLRVQFGADPPALSCAALTVYPGQTVALVGESGSGKSTLAASILGLLAPGGRITEGRIMFDGRDITAASRRQLRAIRGSQIGYVPQDPATNLNPVLTIGFQIREALRANGITGWRLTHQKALGLLDDVGMSDARLRARQYPHQLSGGMCQRALIAIALAARPRLLIADEPTSALDVTVQKQVLDHLDAMTGELAAAVLLITHDLALAVERAEHLIVMYRGTVVEAGPPQQVLDNPRHSYTQRLVAAAPSLAIRSGAATTRPRVRADAATHAGHPIDDVLVATDLAKVFRVGGAPWRPREITAVGGVSFSVRRATTTAIVGESGSGKTTVARMVLGLSAPTAGTVTFDGRDVAGLNRHEAKAFRRRVQPVFQNPYGSLDPLYSIYRTIEEPLRIHGIGDRGGRERAVRELLEQVALPVSVMRRFPRELSGGQRQRVAIARALALQPEMLVCDEAVSALDVVVQAQILALLAELQARLGLTYLFISHDLAVVREIADDVVVMCAGLVVEHRATDEVFERPRDPYTQRLLDSIPRSVAG